MSESKKKFEWWRNIGASFLAASIVKTTLAPIERIKIIFQTDINNVEWKNKNKGQKINSYSTQIKVKLFKFEKNKSK